MSMEHETWRDTDDWRDSPFCVVLYEYAVKNFGFPSDIGTLIAYALVVLVTWYMLIWVARAIITLIWPAFICVVGVFLYRYLSTYEHEDLLDMVFHGLSVIADTIVLVLSKTLEFLLGFLG